MMLNDVIQSMRDEGRHMIEVWFFFFDGVSVIYLSLTVKKELSWKQC
jgi:hypothetical protein